MYCIFSGGKIKTLFSHYEPSLDEQIYKPFYFAYDLSCVQCMNMSFSRVTTVNFFKSFFYYKFTKGSPKPVSEISTMRVLFIEANCENICLRI